MSLVQGEERHPGEEQRGPLPPDQERGQREVGKKKNLQKSVFKKMSEIKAKDFLFVKLTIYGWNELF